MPDNIVRQSRVRFERSFNSDNPQLHLKAFVNGFLGMDVTMLSTDPLFLPAGLAGNVGYFSTNQNQANAILGSPHMDDLVIAGSGGYSFSDNFNRADASDWGVLWNEQHSGGNIVRYVIRSNQGVPVLSSLAPPGFYSFNTPVGQAALTDASIQYLLGTHGSFTNLQTRLRSTTAAPSIGSKFYMLEQSGSSAGSGQMIIWHVTITGASSDTPVEIQRIPLGDPFFAASGYANPGSTIKFSATVE